MPHLVRWHEDYADFGLVVIGLHWQEAKPGELKDRCTAMGVRFTMCEGGRLEGSEASGIPHTSLFDSTGKLIHDGKADGIEAKLRLAIGELLVAEIDKPTRAMQPVVEALRKGGSPFDALKKLNNLKNSGERATTAQAKALSDKLLAGGRNRLERVKSLVKDDPVAAYESASIMAAKWKAFEIGTKAGDLVRTLKADRSVMAELKAKPTLEGIKRLDAAISTAAGAVVDYQSPEFKKKYGPHVKELQRAYKQMKSRYPDARATKEVFEIVEKYELPAGMK